MISRSSGLSRRHIMKFIAASPCVAGFPAAAFAARPYPERLQEALGNIDLSFVQGRLDLIYCHCSQTGRDHSINAIIRLTWAPGVRQHRLIATAPNPKDALEQILSQVETRFVGLAGGRA